jgi:hypothetical protein
VTNIRRVETLMRGHEARPFVLPARWSGAWYRGPFLTMGNRLHGDAFPWWYDPAPYPRNDWWRALTTWFKVFGEESPSDPRATLYTATNTRIQTRNIRLFLRRSSWELTQTIAAPISDQFSYDMVSVEVLGGHRNEAANGGGTSHRISNGGTRVPHGYGVPHYVADPWNITGVAVDMDVRLILDNPAGTDDRANARCVVAIACDLFYDIGAVLPAVGYWVAIGCAGFARVTNDWQRIGFNSYFTGARPDMDVDALRAEYSSTLILADSPPGWTDGGGGGIVTPPTPTPTNARKIIFIGDSNVRGDDSTAGSFRSFRGKALSDLAAAGLSVDSVGREVLPSAGRLQDPEHEGHADARISTTTNNVTDRLDAMIAAAGGASTQITAGPGRIEAAVLMLGLTDYQSEPTGIADRFSGLFADVQAALPTADLIVTTLPPRQGLTEAATGAAFPGYAALNSRIRQIAASTYGVTLADVASLPFVSGDYHSAALMLQSGADKIGAEIARALRLALGIGEGYIIPGAPRRPTVSLRTASSRLHVFRWGTSPAGPAFGSTTIPSAPRSQFYSHTVPISGTPAPSVSMTGLPTGLTNTGATISGTPTAAAGDYTVTVTATNASGTEIRAFTLRIVTAPSVVSTTLPQQVAGQPISTTVQVAGEGPLTVVISGVDTAGLVLDGASITGVRASAGDVTLSVLVLGLGGSATANVTLPVGASTSLPVITTSSLPAGTVGAAYSQTIAATGAGTITRRVVSGTLPPGLSLAPTTGALTGTPTAAGGYGFTVRAENAFTAGRAPVEQTYYLIIAAAGVAPVASPWGQFVRQ